jgi:GNAT superfamily N-acetyltransferase
MPTIEVIQADLERKDHQEAVLTLIDGYSRDPLANNQSLPPAIREALVPGLRRHPTTVILLALDRSREGGGQPVGIAVCFLGFSTFAARPLLNIHDFFTAPEHRGQGVGRRLLEAAEATARQLDCCKLTLEVQENNHPARRLYAAAGFDQYTLAEAGGGAFYLTKPLR